MIGASIFNEDFSEQKLTLIARGGFSQIFVCECNATKQQIVIKKMKSEDDQTLNFLSQEANWIKRLNEENPNIKNIIKIYSQYQYDNSIYIAMEYCPLGSLEKLLIQKQKLSHLELLIFAKQMISVLIYAHKLGLAHSDLKPENVLIRNQNEYVLTDWGSAQQLNHQHSTTLRDNTFFTPGYQAPELQNQNLISSNMKFNYFAADIYSLGMMLLRCTGPSFREIRTISSEADQSDHDWKINKLFKSYVYQKEYQDGVIDKIIFGFLNYSKASRMRLEEALMLINKTHTNLESNIDLYIQNLFHQQNSNLESKNCNYDSKNSNSNNHIELEQSMYESVQLNSINSSQSQNSTVNLQYYNNHQITIPKKKYSLIKRTHSTLNQVVLDQIGIDQSLSNGSQHNNNIQTNQEYCVTNGNTVNKIHSSDDSIHSNHRQSKNNVTNGVHHQRVSQFHNNSDNINHIYSSSHVESGIGSSQDSNSSIIKQEKEQAVCRKDSSRQRIREIKRNQSQDKSRQNKNISISSFNEIFNLSSDVDTFKAYLRYFFIFIVFIVLSTLFILFEFKSNQVDDGNIQQLTQKLYSLTQIKKLFLFIGGNKDLSDNSIYALQNALTNKVGLQELNLDVTKYIQLIQN